MDRKNFALKKIAVLLAVLVLNQTIWPTIALCLTSGPTQPEFSGFAQAGTSDMVDLFTGDFKYNLPLGDVDGFPLNISYSANPRMDEEASWVGLGWSLNPGSISRNLRGIPDDFSGEQIIKETSMAPDRTIGVNGGVDLEIIGIDKLPAGLTIGVGGALSYNTRRGFDFTTSASFNPVAKIGTTNSRISANLGLSSSSRSGLNMNVNVGLASKEGELKGLGLNLGLGLNSRQGLKSLTFQQSLPLGNEDLSQLIGASGIGSITHNFGPFSYTPTSSLPILNESISFSGKVGGELFGLHADFEIGGFFTDQYLAYNSESQVSYGYLNLQNGQDNPQAVLDYNSEVNGQIKDITPNLPLAYGTYDVFTVAGQGIGGTFRAIRNDVGLFRPADEKNTSVSGSLGIELGVGNAAHTGADGFVSESNSYRSIWDDPGSPLTSNLKFRESNSDYKNFVFKFSNDNSRFFNDLFENYGKKDALFLNHENSGSELIPKSTWRTDNNNYQLTGEVINNENTSLNTAVKYLTGEEASEIGLTRNIENYPDPNLGPVYGDCGFTPDPIDRVSFGTPANQLSEFTVIGDGGSRYVYGLPVKNVAQKDFTFSVNGANAITDQTNPDFGLITYDPDDPTTGNSQGREAYYESTTMPSYNHSFLLTGMLSADYVDKTGDGITDDDLGNAVKINYHRSDEAFEWRIPVQKDMAQFHKGYIADSNDDRASFVYGKKELWYVHSIESRTKVAQFYVSDRKDGLGVLDENGGIDEAKTVKQLDRISIFNKSELQQNPANPVPLKTIHFTYDYSLGNDVPNNLNFINDLDENNQGKLTLKSIHFTYQNSERGQLSPYVFGYKEGPDYSMGLYNRWGYPQENPGDYPDVQEYPYVLQGSEEQSSANAGAWSLNSITLPTGAITNIEYEADDYAYVQNKRAGQMMEVVGFANSANATYPFSPKIYNNSPISFNKYIVVEVEDDPNNTYDDVGSMSNAELKKRYFENVGDIYFNVKMNLIDGEDDKERIKGYFEIDPDLEITTSGSHHILIPVKYLKDSKNRPVHPIAFAGMQVLRLQLPEVIHPEVNTNNPGVALFKSIFNVGKEIRKLFRGFEYVAIKKKWAKSIEITNHESWVRLANPDFKKFAGGSRVSKITVSDNWNFGGAFPSFYGQEYDYAMETEIAGVEQSISSGVASYEPAMGGEENLMKQPLAYEEKYKLGPKNHFFSETPIGESLFPNPGIGYSKVRITNIANTDAAPSNLIRTKSGYTNYEFYTAKDFPTKVEVTKVLPKRYKTRPILNFLKIENKEIVSLSQGYSIKLNDMHGKSKSESVYDKNEQLLSSSTYNYKVKSGSGESKILDNTVKLVEEDGNVIEDREIGVEFDLWQETFKERTISDGAGTKISGDFFLAAIFPIIIPTFFPNSNREEIGLSAAITTKVIHKNGVLDNIEVMQDGSKIVTENVAYDAKTGNVLINKTFNEHDDPIYSFTTPAYWAYPYMAHAADNLNTVIPNINIDDGKISDMEAAGKIRAGDELMVLIDGVIENDRVYAVRSETATQFTLIDRQGETYTQAENVDLKVIRSGNRNLLTSPIQQVQALGVDEMNIAFPPDGLNEEIISASASTYKSDFPIECETEEDPIFKTTVLAKNNPYVTGGLGQWRPYQTFSPKKLRGVNGDFTALATTNNPGVYGNYNGALTNYLNGWTYDANAGKWNCHLETWILGEEISKYDRNGNAVESFNALCIPTSAQFGYKNSLPTIVASNTTYEELYNESFEEYAFEEDCNDYDFRKQMELFTENNVKINLSNLSADHAHTGIHSLAVPAGLTYQGGATFLPCQGPCSSPIATQGEGQSDGNEKTINKNSIEKNTDKQGEETNQMTTLEKGEGISEDSPLAQRKLESARIMNTPQRLCGDPLRIERFRDVVNTADGGFLAVGLSQKPQFLGARQSSTSLVDDALLVKLNSTGIPQWEKLIGEGAFSSPEEATAIVATNDGNYVIAGYTGANTVGNIDIFLMKIDPDGNSIWTTSFPGSLVANDNPEMNVELIEMSDGSLVLGARTQDETYSTELLDAYVIKTNSSGTLQWSKVYGYDNTTGSENNDIVSDIIESSDGNIVALTRFQGAEDATGNTRNDIGIMKLSAATGSIIWDKGYGSGDDLEDEGFEIVEMPNGEFQIAGYSAIATGADPNNAEAIILKIDAQGNGLGVEKHNLNPTSVDNFSQFSSLIESNNEVIALGKYNQSTTSLDFHNLLYQKLAIDEIIMQTFNDDLEKLIAIPNGGFALAGAHNENNGPEDVYFAITDAQGTIDGNCESTTGRTQISTGSVTTYNTLFQSAVVDVQFSTSISEYTTDLNCTSCDVDCPTTTPSFTYEPTPVCEGATITFTSTTPDVTNYQWYINGYPHSTNSSFTYEFLTEGYYTVSLEHTFPNCPSIITDKIITVFGDGPTGEESITIKEECEKCNLHVPHQIFDPGSPNAVPAISAGYYPTCEGCLPLFTPKHSTQYLVSGWVATSTSIANNSPVEDAKIFIQYATPNQLAYSETLNPEGPLIDGWQRVSGKISIPDIGGGIDRLYLQLSNNAGSEEAYFDDLRIHPNICNAKSYVYDPYSSRLMAELDENNYALFYEYDDEGLLVRMKRETENGIVTLQEGRTVTKPNPYQQ